MEKTLSFEEEESLLEKNGNNCVKMDKNGNKVIILLLIEEIMPNRAQPRRVFDNGSLVELSESIKENGVIQPIVVREIGDLVGSVFKYELVAGERRLRAAKMAGLAQISCILVEIDEKKSAELAIIENLHREELNIFETATAIASLIEIYGLTQEEVARRLSVTQSAVANYENLIGSLGHYQDIIQSNRSELHPTESETDTDAAENADDDGIDLI